MDALHGMERALLLLIQEHLRCGALSAVLVPLTTLCNHGEIWIALSLLMLCFRSTRRAGALALLSMLVCWGSSEFIVKLLVQRARPFALIPELAPLVPLPTDFSFPSGHTSASMAAAGIHWRVLERRWQRWGALALALLVGFSRLYVGVHYPTDVLVGGLWGWIGSGLFLRWIEPRWAARFADGDKETR